MGVRKTETPRPKLPADYSPERILNEGPSKPKKPPAPQKIVTDIRNRSSQNRIDTSEKLGSSKGLYPNWEQERSRVRVYDQFRPKIRSKRDLSPGRKDRNELDFFHNKKIQAMGKTKPNNPIMVDNIKKY